CLIGSEPNELVAYMNGGTYDVTLIVENDVGCTDTVTIADYITVQVIPDVGFSSTADGLANLCYPILIEFTDTTNANIFDYRVWDLGTGFPVVDNASVGTIYEEPGTYTVSLEVGTTFGCIGFFEQDYVIEGPVADFVLSTDEICLYDSVSMELIDSTDVSYFSWEFGNGVDSAMVNPVTYYYNLIPSGGSTNIQLITWSADSTCSATTEYPFTVNNTIADFSRNNETTLEDTIHCFGVTDVLTNSSIDATTYFWNMGNGTSFFTEDVTYKYITGGTFDISLIALNNNTGCSDTLVKPITVHPPMQTSVDNGLSCIYNTLYLGAYGGETYLWQPAFAVNDSSSQFPFLTIEQDIDLTVQITDTNNCSQIRTVFANYIRPAEEPSWTDTIIDFGTPIDFEYQEGPYQFHDWFSSSVNICDGCDGFGITPDDSEVYGVIVTDELSCFVDTFFFDITVEDEMLFWMPNAFTPDGDGINDLFFPEVTRALPDGYQMLIFNREGTLIWETEDIQAKWAGNASGSNYFADPEMFVWKVRIQDLRSISQEFMGTVTLIR
ncbi:MAG: gliding motility-associated C-terminal domain-containing protein, partial [Bacteroidota bacterium]